jgi:stage V sporulation protein B
VKPVPVLQGRDATRHGATKLGRGTVQILVARIFLLVSGFGVSIVLARGLGPGAFGIYGVVMSFLVWFERIIGGGIPRGTTTLLSQAPEQRAAIEQSTRVLLALLTLPVFVLAWIFAPALADYLGAPSGTTVIRVAALNLPAMAIFFTYDSIFNGLRMFGDQSLLHIVSSIAKLAGVAILLFVGLSVTSAFVAQVAATVVAISWAAYRFRIGGARASASIMRQLIVLAVPLGAYLLLLMALTNLSLWQLQAARQDADDVGFYVAGLNITRIMMMVPSTVSVVLYASLIRIMSTSEHHLATKYVQGAVRFAVVLIVPACVLLAVDASAVMTLLFGPEFAAGGRILAMLCVTFSMVALLDVFLNALMASGGLARSAGVLAVLVPVLYALNALWIPDAGAVGAAAASVVVLTVGAAISLGMIYKRLGPPLKIWTLLRVGGAGIVIGVICAVFPAAGFWLVVKLGALGLTYLALLWGMGELTVQDLKPFALWKESP